MPFVLVLILAMLVWASRYTKVGPNQVLVVSGNKHRVTERTGRGGAGLRIVKGGGTFVMPVFEKVDLLSLELPHH